MIFLMILSFNILSGNKRNNVLKKFKILTFFSFEKESKKKEEKKDKDKKRKGINLLLFFWQITLMLVQIFFLHFKMKNHFRMLDFNGVLSKS